MRMAMEDISSVRELINLWPTRSALVDDVRVVAPLVAVTTSQVHKWAEKGGIPAKYHHPVLLAAKLRGFKITADLIVRLHAVGRDAA